MQVDTYSRVLLSGFNYNIRSFMFAPTVNPGKNGVTIAVTPTVFISYDPKIKFGDRRPTDVNFKVTLRNHHRVLRFFETALSWLSRKDYPDLFLVDDETGNLMLNMDYHHLKAIIKSSRYEPQVMLAIPMVVRIDSGQFPGVMLSINRTNYSLALTEDDLYAIYSTLSGFSFQMEPHLLLETARHPEFWPDADTFGDAVFTRGTPMQGYRGENRKVEW